jgi:hypothetical protein
MINIDSRLLVELDANEYFLLSFLTSKMNAENISWYGNKTICKELKWSMVRLQSTKKRLVEKKLLEVTPRFNDKNPAQTSNVYRILTPLTSNYIPTLKLDTGGTSKLGMGDNSKLDTPATSNLVTAPTSKLGNEVLTNEALDTEELTIEELNREKKWRFFDQALIYKSFIDCLFPSMKDHADDFHYRFYDFSEEMETEITEIANPTVRNLLEKIWGAAGKLFSAFQQINRPRPEFQDFKITRETRKPNARDECDYQIKAYADFCRISGRYLCTDPDKLPEKLIQTDWVVALHDLVKDDIKKEKYDPATEEEELFSQWLIEMYYWQPLGVCVCKRYNNRIMMDGVEYLSSSQYQKPDNRGKLQ